ncbi:1,3-beta-glucanosyltransferase GAS4 [Nakaseomyces glabratus]|nr:1,3-beta-glucanosyltransferase GAS4 [Nakaseomyces glabratus]KTB15999.1 1,3-beta-glucanosyltransferase GAS4 [Nakaseomyces glabratus]
MSTTMQVFIFWVLFLGVGQCYLNPITIQNKHFVDSVTGEPFFIKGVDYQPGGAAGINGESDPLSDPKKCARDIVLFQELGINTVRVYSINPDLDHNICMSMLSMAGIYLILDVNSPLPNQHLNRYEPWKTYNPLYLEHVFKVVSQFSGYNNTLGFFAGNEVINDEESATNSPIYVKKLIGDIKEYIAITCDRLIPVGYSAADDLNYRVSLSQYLECSTNSNKVYDSVDFYGVNSYQWCGEQTIRTSGYDKLIEAYRNYTKPVMLSEFGCNRVLPRQFGEVEVLYSKEMYTVFSGGLVYEYSQEPNNYGLVKINHDGSVRMLPDFVTLQEKYKKIALPNRDQLHKELEGQSIGLKRNVLCLDKYENLEISGKTENDIPAKAIKTGIQVKRGHILELLNSNTLQVQFEIFDVYGQRWQGPKIVTPITRKTSNKKENEAKTNGANGTSESLLIESIFTMLLMLIAVQCIIL